MTETIEATPELLRNLKQEDMKHGADARYWPLNDNWGVKFFFDAETRDRNYDRQLQAIELELAPQLGDKVECVIFGCPMFGFITEHVLPFNTAIYNHFGIPERRSACKPGSERNKWDQVFDRSLPIPDHLLQHEANMLNAIEALPRDISEKLSYDLHDGNWGITKDGREVVLDFSRQNYEFSDWSS